MRTQMGTLLNIMQHCHMSLACLRQPSINIVNLWFLLWFPRMVSPPRCPGRPRHIIIFQRRILRASTSPQNIAQTLDTLTTWFQHNFEYPSLYLKGCIFTGDSKGEDLRCGFKFCAIRITAYCQPKILKEEQIINAYQLRQHRAQYK